MDAASTADAARVLRGIDVLASMPDEMLAAAAAVMTALDVPAGTELVRLGEPADAMFVIASGQFGVWVPGDQGPLQVATLGPGRGIGEMQMVSGGTRTATVSALVPSRVYRLARTDFSAFAARAPEALRAIVERVRERTQQAQVAALLPKLVGELSPADLDDLLARVAVVSLSRGDALFRQGEPGDAWYVVVSGRLHVVVESGDGGERVVGEASRGDSVGEMALLTGEPRSASVYALRDTVLVRMGKPEFDQLLGSRPALMLTIIRALATRIRNAGRREADRGLGQHFAVVPTPGVDSTALAARLAQALAKLGPTLLLNPARLAAEGVMENAAAVPADHPAWLRFGAWLDGVDSRVTYVVFDAGEGQTEWARRSVRQADHVVLVAERGGSPEPGDTELALLPPHEGRRATRTLVLLHPDGKTPPSGTRRWLDAREVDAHLHLRLDRDADVERLARVLAGRAVGLALGGGGARGFAHIGVIRAMEEAGVPIDMVGGTSMGSIIAGQYALGCGPERMVQLNEDIIRIKPFTEYTVPVMSLLRSKRVEQSAKMAFGDTDIEDLWLPWFGVSCDLATAEMVVHDRGPAWAATRASGALPGVVLPMLIGTRVLVDGGVVNNLPGDVMRQRCRGRVVVVNVSPDEERAFAIGTIPSPWQVFWSWVLPFRTAISVPSIVQIMMRTATLASAGRARAVERDADLYLRPPVDHFGLLDFDRIRDIVSAGHAYARERLASFTAPPGAP